jgi:hypothetical protein
MEDRLVCSISDAKDEEALNEVRVEDKLDRMAGAGGHSDVLRRH